MPKQIYPAISHALATNRKNPRSHEAAFWPSAAAFQATVKLQEPKYHLEPWQTQHWTSSWLLEETSRSHIFYGPRKAIFDLIKPFFKQLPSAETQNISADTHLHPPQSPSHLHSINSGRWPAFKLKVSLQGCLFCFDFAKPIFDLWSCFWSYCQALRAQKPCRILSKRARDFPCAGEYWKAPQNFVRPSNHTIK